MKEDVCALHAHLGKNMELELNTIFTVHEMQKWNSGNCKLMALNSFFLNNFQSFLFFGEL